MPKPTVIDFFCGAGGFSEGFRQQDFDIILGIDSWQPAIDTYNHNFGLNCLPKNMLDFEHSIEEIEALPDTDVIVGSPPCVSFSNSNKSGKADKSLGVRLTETFLRIVVIKKFQKNSQLKAWFMENVTNSIKYFKDHYNFSDLNLSEWAKINGYHPNKRVISIVGNNAIVNSGHYGSPQLRKRMIVGEIISKHGMIIPDKTHSLLEEKSILPKVKSVKQIKYELPKPTVKKSSRRISDPLYNNISIPLSRITDHFYDTGLYQSQWENSEFLKKNHPYMGKMSFPENELKPSRTITATKIDTSREAIIYKSEYNRKGDGMYRIPTIREMATLMSFPITYQFLVKGKSSKCRLVGNAVCPSVSRALAKTVRTYLKLNPIDYPIIQMKINVLNAYNLNTYNEKVFDNPPVKNKGSRFRRHPFKNGNMTVTLSNYDIGQNGNNVEKWFTSVQYGYGIGFPTMNYQDGLYEELKSMLEVLPKGGKFLEIINNGFTDQIAPSHELQLMYEQQQSFKNFLKPTELIKEVDNIISELQIDDEYFIQDRKVIFYNKKSVPLSQLFALYAINRIATYANQYHYE